MATEAKERPETTHSPLPWVWQNSPGAGIEIRANIGAKNCGDFRTTGEGPIRLFDLIACERWMQFAPADWYAMQQANAVLICTAVNSQAALLAAAEAARTLLTLPEEQSLKRDELMEKTLADLTTAIQAAKGE